MSFKHDVSYGLNVYIWQTDGSVCTCSWLYTHTSIQQSIIVVHLRWKKKLIKFTSRVVFKNLAHQSNKKMPLHIGKSSDIEGLHFQIRIVEGPNLLPPNGVPILLLWAVAKKDFLRTRHFSRNEKFLLNLIVNHFCFHEQTGTKSSNKNSLLHYYIPDC